MRKGQPKAAAGPDSQDYPDTQDYQVSDVGGAGASDTKQKPALGRSNGFDSVGCYIPCGPLFIAATPVRQISTRPSGFMMAMN